MAYFLPDANIYAIQCRCGDYGQAANTIQAPFAGQPFSQRQIYTKSSRSRKLTIGAKINLQNIVTPILAKYRFDYLLWNVKPNNSVPAMTNCLKINGMSFQLLVTDLNRSMAFYTQHLGFEVAFLYGYFYAGITNGGHSIHLKSGTPNPEERTNRRKNQDLDFTFSVTGIEKVYDYLQTKSVEFTQPLRKMPYGREFYIADPDGYILAFIEENT